MVEIMNSFQISTPIKTVAGYPAEIFMQPKVSDEDRDWTFLEVYDSVVCTYFLKIADYIGTGSFKKLELRQNVDFLVTLKEADIYYKQWCQWNVFQRNEENKAKLDALVIDDDMIKTTAIRSGRNKVWSEATRWDRLISRMANQDMAKPLLRDKKDDNLGMLYLHNCNDGTWNYKINNNVNIDKVNALISRGADKIERDLFLKLL